jgi:hypothetical protein
LLSIAGETRPQDLPRQGAGGVGAGGGLAFPDGAFLTHGGRLALGFGVGHAIGLGIGELGESTAEGEPNSAADCGSAMGVADLSGATVTVVFESGALRSWATGSPGGGAATGLDWAMTDAAKLASARPRMTVRILNLSHPQKRGDDPPCFTVVNPWPSHPLHLGERANSRSLRRCP